LFSLNCILFSLAQFSIFFKSWLAQFPASKVHFPQVSTSRSSVCVHACVCARVCVKFCCKFVIKFTETFRLLNQAYEEDCMSRMQCYVWFKRFKEGRMSVNEDPRPGWLSTSTNGNHVERFQAVMHGNCHLTVQEAADEVGISIGSCHHIFYWETSDVSR
jgi:hypothetical protein